VNFLPRLQPSIDSSHGKDILSTIAKFLGLGVAVVSL